MTELRFAVSGIKCHHCVSRTTAKIAKVPGVDNVHVEPHTRWLVVSRSGFEIGRQPPPNSHR